MASRPQRNEPNSTGKILHDQAVASIDELKSTLELLKKAVPAAVPLSQQQNQSSADGSKSDDVPDNSTSNSAVQVLLNKNNQIDTNSEGVQKRVADHEKNRQDILRERKQVISDLRKKFIEPLASQSYHRLANQQHGQPTATATTLGLHPLLPVHAMTMNLLTKDSDLAQALNSDKLLSMNESGNVKETRGFNNLTSLVPVAWCIQVSYLEAARIEIARGKYILQQQQNNNQGSNDTPEETVDEQLSKYVKDWKSITDLGKIPISVLNYFRSELSRNSA